MFEYAAFAVRNPVYVTKNARKQWSVRREILKFAKANRQCEATGKTKRLHVHHEIPVAIAPELAGNPSNFVMLEKWAHFQDGHNGNWKNYVPNVREVIKFRQTIKTVAASSQ